MFNCEGVRGYSKKESVNIRLFVFLNEDKESLSLSAVPKSGQLALSLVGQNLAAQFSWVEKKQKMMTAIKKLPF